MLDITEIEQNSLVAWPALETIIHEGWCLRFADGHTKRANSVTVMGPSRSDLDERITGAETAYRTRGLPPIFRITPLADAKGPDTGGLGIGGLDMALAHRGYACVEPSWAMIHPTLHTLGTVDPRVDHPICHLSQSPEPDFCRALADLKGLSDKECDTLAAILALITVPACYCLLTDRAHRVLAAGFAVLTGTTLGFYDLITRPSERGCGSMRQVMAGLSTWGVAAGACHAQLFVTAHNAPACRLYTGLGFVPVYGYHYRIKPEPGR